MTEDYSVSAKNAYQNKEKQNVSERVCLKCRKGTKHHFESGVWICDICGTWY